jgi:hypothetical protein
MESRISNEQIEHKFLDNKHEIGGDQNGTSNTKNCQWSKC